MTDRPPILSLIGAPTPATLGPATELHEEPPCGVCGLRPAPTYGEVEYVFDTWDGEDLIRAVDTYAVSDRLAGAMAEEEITGARLRPARTVAADGFWLGDEAYASELPAFHVLEVTGTARGPHDWYVPLPCPGCRRTNWTRTEAGEEAEAADLTGEPGPPRRVYADSWSGDDLFALEDPGPPLVTGRFQALVDRLGSPEVLLHPAAWVDEAAEPDDEPA